MSCSLQNGMELFAPTQVTQASHATTFGLLITPRQKYRARAFGPDTGGTLSLGQLGLRLTKPF